MNGKPKRMLLINSRKKMLIPVKMQARRFVSHKDDGQPRLTVIMFGKRELSRHCRKLGLLIPVKMQARRFLSHNITVSQG